MMKTSSCCGCCSVKTGVIIIGILHMILSFIFLILACIKPSEYSFIITLCIQYLLSILLLVGVKKRNANFILPFVCVYFGNIVGILPVSFTQKIQIGVYISAPIWYYFVVSSIAILLFALSFYFFLVVYTYYQELMHEKFSSSLLATQLSG